MRGLLLLTLFVIVFHRDLYAQFTGAVSGKVIDGQTNQPLQGATITVNGSSASAVADNEGHFRFLQVASGDAVIRITYVGYEDMEERIAVFPNTETIINASLQLADKVGSEVVVAASKRAEKITNAPASIHVIGTKDLQQFSGSNIGELISKVQGVEFVRSGVDFVAFNARGFNRAINNKFFQMVDGRNMMSPLSPGLPLSNLATVVKDDIERIEIILGPQSALFGPNVHNGLAYLTTKDPRKYQGTTLSVSAGTQSQFSVRLRQAAKINNRWAYKITGEYATGKDFTFHDSVYAGGGMFGPRVAIPERNVNFNFRHIRGEAHVYYSLTSKDDIIISGGGGDNNFIGVSNAGRNQMRGLRNSFLQLRYKRPNFLLNVYNTWGTFGRSYSIAGYTRDYWNATHTTPPSSHEAAEQFALRNRFKEKSQRLNAETQFNHTFKKAAILLVAGLSYQKEKPNSFGIGLVDSAKRIYVTQVGAVVQLEKTLPLAIRFVAASRFDNHSNYGNFVSPKLTVLKGFGEGTFRVSWAKGYAMPSIAFQYTNASGQGFGNGPGVTYIPNFTRISDAVYKTTVPLKPEEISTWEIGYKGQITEKLFVDINYYNGLTKNFLSSAQTVGGRAIAVGDIPVTHHPTFAGTVTNDTLYNASFSTFFNYGDVRAYGVDVGLNYAFNKIISVGLKYSWFGSDLTRGDIKNDANNNGYVSADEKSLNAPKNRGVAMLNFDRLLKQNLSVNISARFVEQYDFYTGNQVGTATGEGKRGQIDQGPGRPPLLVNFDRGPLGGFTSIDVNMSYVINKMTNLNIGVSNLFNTHQQEFVGCPSIGRLIMAEVRVHLPTRPPSFPVSSRPQP